MKWIKTNNIFNKKRKTERRAEEEEEEEEKKKNSTRICPSFPFASDSYLISQTSILRMYVVRRLPTGATYKKKTEEDKKFSICMPILECTSIPT